MTATALHDWPERRLGDLATMGSGGTPSSKVPKYYGGGIPWVSITDMTASAKYVARTAKTLSHEGLSASAAKLYEPGVVLYAMYASLGECAIAVGRVSSSQAILGIQAGAQLDRSVMSGLMWDRGVSVDVRHLRRSVGLGVGVCGRC